MRGYTSLVLGGVAALFSITAASTVSDLTTANFDEYVSSHDAVMVEFYAPWCSVCQELEPVYEQTAAMISNTSKSIRFARVNCVDQGELCDTYSTPMYPTLRLFQGLDHETIYNGARESSDMISFAEVRTQPAVQVLTANELDSFKDSASVVVVGSWSRSDTASNDTFSRIADELLDYYTFGATNDKAGDERPSITLYKKYDSRELHFDGELEEDAIFDFIALNSVPLVGAYTQKWSWYYPSNSAVPLLAAFANSGAERTALGDLMRPLAKKYKNALRFVTVDPVKERLFAVRLSVPEGQKSTLVIRDSASQVFHLSGEVAITENALSDWIEDFQQDKLKPYTEPEPEQEAEVAEDSVVVLNSANFDDMVYADDYDALVEFYAPWCGHCKKLVSKYAQLATVFAETDSKVRIAKIDATEHQIPDHPVKSYPTILFFPAHRKQNPIAYEGERSVDDFASFVRQHSGVKEDSAQAGGAGSLGDSTAHAPVRDEL